MRDAMTRPRVETATDVVVSVRGVSHTYGQGYNVVTALKAITLDVHAGRLVAITGRSGSGKTTLLNLIGGLDTPTTGTILVGGRDVVRLTERERTELRRHQVAFVFQSFALVPTLSARENVDLALHIAGVPARERARRARRAPVGGSGRAARPSPESCFTMTGFTRPTSSQSPLVPIRAPGPAERGPRAAPAHAPGAARDPHPDAGHLCRDRRWCRGK